MLERDFKCLLLTSEPLPVGHVEFTLVCQSSGGAGTLNLDRGEGEISYLLGPSLVILKFQ